ncbi:MAG: DUF2306 domain-containing protein [Lewinella sp.]|nr:DUF2306 domain-containing protein [Lewinella sp.]
MTISLRTSLSVLLLLAYACFVWLMVAISWQYLTLEPDVAFLRIKQEVVGLPYYLPAFFVHAFSSVLVLSAGFTQFSPVLRRRQPGLHRAIGRLYLAVVLLLAAPSGLVLAWHANGGWSSRFAFGLLGLLWFIFTGQAWWYARRRRWSAHRDFMIRSFALAMAAISLRAWKYVLVALFHPRPMDVYRTVAWLSWVLNLLIAEIIIFKLNQRKT